MRYRLLWRIIRHTVSEQVQDRACCVLLNGFLQLHLLRGPEHIFVKRNVSNVAFFRTPRSALSFPSPFPLSFFLFILAPPCPLLLSLGVQSWNNVAGNLPSMYSCNKAGCNWLLFVSLKWCRCYQFHCWLWMLNMWIRRGGWGRRCRALTASGSWSTHACELLQPLSFFFPPFFQK